MNINPERPYVYQPFGVLENDGKIYGIAGIPNREPLKGLTKEDADKICKLLNEYVDFMLDMSDQFRIELNLG